MQQLGEPLQNQLTESSYIHTGEYIQYFVHIHMYIQPKTTLKGYFKDKPTKMYMNRDKVFIYEIIKILFSVRYAPFGALNRYLDSQDMPSYFIHHTNY